MIGRRGAAWCKSICELIRPSLDQGVPSSPLRILLVLIAPFDDVKWSAQALEELLIGRICTFYLKRSDVCLLSIWRVIARFWIRASTINLSMLERKPYACSTQLRVWFSVPKLGGNRPSRDALVVLGLSS